MPGPSTTVTLTINSLPNAPGGSDTSVCLGQTIPNLLAIGTNITWYYDSLLTSVAFIGNPFPTGRTAVGSYHYYAVQLVNGCYSKAKKITLNINATPATPIASDVNACFGTSIPGLSAGGNNIRWYIDPTLNTLVSTDNPFNTLKTSVGAYPYWVTQTQVNCVSPATKVTLNIYGIPSIPATSDTNSCFGLPVPNLKATGVIGSTINWYSKSFGTPLVYTGNSFPIGKTAQGSYSYYVTQTLNGCVSTNNSATLTINPNPVYNSNTHLNETYCLKKDGAIQVTASGTGTAGELPLQYSDDNGATYQLPSLFGSLASGTYHLKVENQFGCVTDGGNVVINPGGLPV